jgi:peptide chain release factor 1
LSDLLDRIASFEEHAARLEARLGDPALAAQPGEYGKVAKELKGLRPLVEAAARYRATLGEIEGARALLADPDAEVSALARAELEALERVRSELER